MNGTIEGSCPIKRAHFIPVEDPKLFIPILIERHPQSCFMYNQLIACDKFKNTLNFYTLSTGLNSDSWLVSDFSRDDNGHDISISAPNSITRDKKPIASEIKECFSSGGLIDWDDAAMFVGLEKPVSAMILDICVNIKGNVSRLHPCVLFYIEKEKALDIDVGSSPGAVVKRLDQDDGTDFIFSNWKYAKNGSRNVISQCIGATASAGVFVDGKYASGVITFGDGMLHCLYSSKEYRNRGFAKMTMKYCFKEFAKEGCHPCSTVEVKNSRAIGFHESLGCKSASIVDYIDMTKLEVD